MMSIESIFEGKLEKKDIFYVFIDLPDFWEVRADGLNGAVYNNDQKSAMIYFKQPIDLRLVDRVEWITDSGEIYKIDYYGDFGYPYSVAYLEEGKVVTKSYFTPEHEEKIQINYSNGVVSLYDKGHVYRNFESEEEFIRFYDEIM